MPTYEYECGQCRYHFDRRQSFDAEPVAECPRCQGKGRRVLHSVPIVFKGSGFYVTDHGSRGNNPGRKEEKEGEAKAEAKAKEEN